METNFDLKDILKVLPHRYPFLLVDKIIKLVPDETIVALKNVTINEPFFQGHFPDMPIMPGVLILEAMAQAGGILFLQSRSEQKKNSLLFFIGLDKVRFRKPVVPGDQLLLNVKCLRLRSKVVKMFGVATVNEKRVAEAELMASFGDKI